MAARLYMHANIWAHTICIPCCIYERAFALLLSSPPLNTSIITARLVIESLAALTCYALFYRALSPVPHFRLLMAIISTVVAVTFCNVHLWRCVYKEYCYGNVLARWLGVDIYTTVVCLLWGQVGFCLVWLADLGVPYFWPRFWPGLWERLKRLGERAWRMVAGFGGGHGDGGDGVNGIELQAMNGGRGDGIDGGELGVVNEDREGNEEINENANGIAGERDSEQDQQGQD